jgi:hypothetical protein
MPQPRRDQPLSRRLLPPPSDHLATQPPARLPSLDAYYRLPASRLGRLAMFAAAFVSAGIAGLVKTRRESRLDCVARCAPSRSYRRRCPPISTLTVLARKELALRFHVENFVPVG